MLPSSLNDRMKRLKIAALILCAMLLIGSFAYPTAGDTDTAAPDQADAADVTDTAVLTLPERASAYAANLTDGAVASYVLFKKDEQLLITLSQMAAALVLEWNSLPKSYELSIFDANGAVLTDETVTPAFLNMFHELPANAATLCITASEACELSTVQLFGLGTLPSSVQRWTQPQAEPDLLLIAAYPGNVLECFGGLYPSLLANGVNVNILYLSWRTRRRTQEALDTLWALGQTVYPYCLGLTDRGANDDGSVWVDWGKSESTSQLTRLLQQIRPAVIVTHGAAGDESYDLAAATRASQIVLDAVKRASSAAKDAFTPQKVYLHEASDMATMQNVDTPLWRFDGATAAETAESYFSAFQLTRQFLRTLTTVNSYTLVATAVGEDELHNDLMEHVSYTPLFTPLPSPTPAPTPEPTDTPSPAPTVEPTPSPTATADITANETSMDGAQSGSGTNDLSNRLMTVLTEARLLLCIVLCVGLLLSLLLLCLIGRLQKKKRGRVLTAMLPLLIALLFCCVWIGVALSKQSGVPAAAEQTALPTQTPTLAPTATPSPTPSAEPTASPTPEATQTPQSSDPWADKFLPADSEQTELVYADDANGVWYYRSDVLAIEIERHSTDEPLVWFTAHIYMREVDSFRSVIAAPNYSGRFTTIPWQLARQSKAVLLITGDNLINMDTELKGILIRCGKVFQRQENRESCAAFLQDTLTLQTYEKGSVTVNELLQLGVGDVFSFGPVLLHNGERGTHIEQSRVYGDNPRTGIGMVEAGHYVAIVVDGRRPEYSCGNTMDEFTDMFLAEGCVEAYNLDGGVSAAMVFMGEQLNHHGNEKDWSKQRGLPDALVFGYSNAVPSVDDPVVNTGSDTE